MGHTIPGGAKGTPGMAGLDIVSQTLVGTLVELANAYRAIASGLAAEPHVLKEVLDSSGRLLWSWNG